MSREFFPLVDEHVTVAVPNNMERGVRQALGQVLQVRDMAQGILVTVPDGERRFDLFRGKRPGLREDIPVLDDEHQPDVVVASVWLVFDSDDLNRQRDFVLEQGDGVGSAACW